MINNKEEFRKWLEENHDKEKEIWLALKRGKPADDGIFYYLDAVYVALCFGWIDSTTKKIDGITYQRFSKRNKNSYFTELNKERCRYLIKEDLMTEAGLKIIPDLNKRYIIDLDIVNLLKENRLYSKFLKFPKLYQRVRTYNISFYKNIDMNLYKKALNHFLEETKKGKMYGNWNDYGRLKGE